MKKVFLLALGLGLFNGCTVISYDRVFPKVTWAWTYEAKEQRRQKREREEGEKAYRDQQTNNK